MLDIDVGRFLLCQKERPDRQFDPGLYEIFTPLVPFRWFSRSLS